MESMLPRRVAWPAPHWLNLFPPRGIRREEEAFDEALIVDARSCATAVWFNFCRS